MPTPGRGAWKKLHPGTEFGEKPKDFLDKAAQKPDPKPSQNLQKAIAGNQLSTLEVFRLQAFDAHALGSAAPHNGACGCAPIGRGGCRIAE